MKYKYFLFISIIMSLCIWGYFSFQRKIIFIEHPTLEINSVFHYQEYIYKIKKGSIKEVTYNAKDLNIHALGHYQVTYFFKGKEYHLKIKVIDSKKPQIKEIRPLKIEKGKSYDLKQGLSIKDNSHQYNLTIDPQNFNPHKTGTYTVIYKVTDLSNNQTLFKRQVEVLEKLEIGTSIESNEKIVYLTFDDGPSGNTDKILTILDQYQAKATFFVTGCHQEYNYLIKKAYQKGHTIGLHSYQHEYPDIYQSKKAYFNDLDKIGKMVKEIIGFTPHYIRFPGGSSNKVSKNYCTGLMSILTKEVIKQGYQYYDWNGDTNDASSNNVSVHEIISSVTNENHQNIMILAHDTNAKNTTVEALPSIISFYQKKGYSFQAINDESFYVHHHVQN